MKNRISKNFLLIFSVFLLAGLFSAAGEVQAEADKYLFQNDLELGAEGGDVLMLQKLLIQGGYLKITRPSPGFGYGPNGYYGEQTKTAVMKWQKARGISPVSGIFGPLSRAKANLGYILIPDRSSVSASITAATSAPAVSNGRIIAENTCTTWTYTDWSACSAWGNQTRSIVSAWPAGCAGGDYVLEQPCLSSSAPATVMPATASSGLASVGTFRPSVRSAETLDDRLLNAAFLDNGHNVGLTCKPWVNKVVSLATDKTLVLPQTRDDNYTWNLQSGGRVISKACSIENVGRGDIIQMKITQKDWPHTAIVVAAMPTGMIWIHSNWQAKKMVSVDFITYAYFKATFGQDYSIYHLQ